MTRPEPIKGHDAAPVSDVLYLGKPAKRVTCSCGDTWVVPEGLPHSIDDTIEFHYKYAGRSKTRVD